MAVLDRAFKRKRFIKESNPRHKNLYYFKPNDTFAPGAKRVFIKAKAV